SLLVISIVSYYPSILLYLAHYSIHSHSTHLPHPISLYSSAHHRDLHSFPTRRSSDLPPDRANAQPCDPCCPAGYRQAQPWPLQRSEEHTSELQSLTNLVFRLLL